MVASGIEDLDEISLFVPDPQNTAGVHRLPPPAFGTGIQTFGQFPVVQHYPAGSDRQADGFGGFGIECAVENPDFLPLFIWL
jgi:hypothetical protein